MECVPEVGNDLAKPEEPIERTLKNSEIRCEYDGHDGIIWVIVLGLLLRDAVSAERTLNHAQTGHRRIARQSENPQSAAGPRLHHARLNGPCARPARQGDGCGH